MKSLFSAPAFTDESYVELLRVLKSQGYQFVKMTNTEPPLPLLLNYEGPSSVKKVVLRHDVDLSPEGALKLGRMERDEGVSSHFFFQLNCGAYQMLSPECVQICKELQQMGHLVGLHVDSVLFPEEESCIAETLAWIRHNLFSVDPVISFHRPASATLGVSYSAFISAYAKEWFEPSCYASDSRGEDGFYAKLEELINKKAPFIQLLLHPCWWENETDRRKIWLRLRERQIQSVDQYLLNNFPKVFRTVVESGL